MSKNPSIYTQISNQVLKQLKSRFMNYDNTPFCFVQISHRSRFYQNLNVETMNMIKKYFKADDYEVLLMQSGTAMSSVFFNLVEPENPILFYSAGLFSKKFYEEMKRYHKKTSMVTDLNSLMNLVEDQSEEMRKIIHFNKVEDGLLVPDIVLPQQIRKNTILIKNISYCVPFTQENDHNEDIVYFESEAGFGVPGFTVMLIHKEFMKTLIAKPKCPDMFDFLQMHKMKSVVNTPFTLATLVLYENIKYMKENQEALAQKVFENKKAYKEELAQLGFNVFQRNQRKDLFSESFNFIRVAIEEANEKSIKKLEEFGWYISESNIICLFIQPQNSNPLMLRKHMKYSDSEITSEQ